MIPIGDSLKLRSVPFVTWALIALNVSMFFNEVLRGSAMEAFVREWGFIPARFFYLGETYPEAWAERWVPVLTSMFLHGGWAHLLGNMVYLWIFGDNVEDHLGHLRYLGLYFVGGVGAALAHAYAHPDSVIPTIGASGAISAVLGGFLILFPYARVQTLVPLLFIIVDIVEIPAVLYLGFWLLMQIFSGFLSSFIADGAGGVAWWAHAGGFVVGMAVAPLLRRGSYPRVWRDELVRQ